MLRCVFVCQSAEEDRTRDLEGEWNLADSDGNTSDGETARLQVGVLYHLMHPVYIHIYNLEYQL